MRIYNGTKKNIDMPLSGIQRLQIAPHSVSQEFMPNSEFLSLLVSSYDYSELALIVSGPYEINMCSSVSGSVGFVVQSLEEAIERFAPKDVHPTPTKLEIVEEVAPVTPEEIKTEAKEEQEAALETAPQVEETVVIPTSEEPTDEVEEKNGEETDTTEVPVEETSEKPYVSKKNKNKKKH